MGRPLVTKYIDDTRDENHRVVDNNNNSDEDGDHHVRIHVETPYRKSNTPLDHNSKTRTKRQLFQITPFPKLIPKTKFPVGQKPGRSRSHNESEQTQVQKRERVATSDTEMRVPIIAESNLGIIHDRHNEELFETAEKKHNILKIQKRLAGEWKGFGNAPHGTLRGRSVERNPIVQLLRSAAGKKTQKILGLNSKSFDIFPGPLPRGEEAPGNAVKGQQSAAYQPQMRGYGMGMASRRQQQPDGYYQQTPQRSFRQPLQQRGGYGQPPLMRPSMRSMGSNYGIQPVEMPQPVEGFSNAPRMQQRYNAPTPQQTYMRRPQRVVRQSFLPPPTAAPVQEPMQEMMPGMVRGRDEFFQPNEPPTGMRNTMSRFAPGTQPPVNGLQERITAYRNGLEGDAREQDQLIQDQINQISQDEGSQYRGDAKLLQVSRQEMQNLPYAAENGVANDLPKMGDPAPVSMVPAEQDIAGIGGAGGGRGFQPASFFTESQPQQMEEDETLRRQMLAEESGHTRSLPPTPQLQQQYQEQQQVQQVQAFQQAQIQPQQYAQQLMQSNGEVGSYPQKSRLHARGGRVKPQQQQQQTDDEDDEEKPEVHVHISTEKRKEIAKPAKDDGKDNSHGKFGELKTNGR